MSMQDPLADMFVRIRNAHAVYKANVSMPTSKLKAEVCRVLLDEGYIEGYEERSEEGRAYKTLVIELKYYKKEPVIEMLRSVSTPGLRVYRKCRELPVVNENLGIAVISTAKGVMSNIKARAAGLGGEVLCLVF